MPSMTFALALICFTGAAVLAIWLAVGARWGGDRAVRQNLKAGFAPSEAEKIRNAPDFGWARQFTTAKGRERLEVLYAKAGRPVNWPIARLMAYKVYALAAAVMVSLLLLLLSGFNNMMVLVTVVMVPVSYFVPDLLLHSRGIERQKEISLQLADTLDQMMIAVEAGLGFETAMDRAGHGGKGALAEELVRTLQEMRVGIPRRDAYLALEERTDVPDLRQFTRAVIQADAYGISIATVLRTQADEMRVKRRQRAEEAAQKIPTKIVIPLMLFVLPVLFLTVLGPAVLNAMKMMQ
ncbi:type II secretion system F family protein [Kocuria rosea]|uniref:type II secretion system F family protein n=1 Tax=Kocuria rosea TaxID=1275 RepID=UPI00203EEEC6|nr:type II secretion system F family protein [Kocuria rosea]MCM3688705.1 type II secretion system F family protein [Kocuria rosea]